MIEQFEKLKQDITRIQVIMSNVSTGHGDIQNYEGEYQKLYFSIKDQIANFKKNGMIFPDINYFSSLWDFYSHWKAEFPHYQQRREYIRSLYKPIDDILMQILMNQAIGRDEIDELFKSIHIDQQEDVSKTQILAVFANPKGSDPLRLATESRVIHQCLERCKHRENIGLKIIHASTIDDFARALLDQDYRIVQFSGHGTEIGLAFENELGQINLIPQEALANTLQRYSPPIECVILNACYSNIQANLISLGVLYTIGMDGAISDEAAIEFTRGFYDAIGAGKNIEFAYEEGINRMELKGCLDSSPCLIKS